MDESRERPFLDTNVLFSGLSGTGSPPAGIVDRHRRGRLTIVVSRYVLDELVGAIQRKRPEIIVTLRRFLVDSPPEICPLPTLEEVRAAERRIDAKDAPILAAAIKSGATCLVSGNTGHFTPDVARCAGVPILTLATCLATLVL